MSDQRWIRTSLRKLSRRFTCKATKPALTPWLSCSTRWECSRTAGLGAGLVSHSQTDRALIRQAWPKSSPHLQPTRYLRAQFGHLLAQALHLGEDRRRLLLDHLALGRALGFLRLHRFRLHGVDHDADEQVEHHEGGHDDEADEEHPGIGMLLHHRLGDVVGQ